MSGILLGHIIIRDGIAVDPNKVKAIREAQKQCNAKALSMAKSDDLVFSQRCIRKCIKHLFNGRMQSKMPTIVLKEDGH